MIRFNYQIAIICSAFNAEITEKLLKSTLTRLIKCGVDKNQIEIFKVPGAIEIPLIAKFLALSKKFHAIISLACVIRGETDHYDYVCQQVSDGCQQIMLEYTIPVIFGVLTTNNIPQAKKRINKGVEVADAAIDMIKLINNIRKK